MFSIYQGAVHTVGVYLQFVLAMFGLWHPVAFSDWVNDRFCAHCWVRLSTFIRNTCKDIFFKVDQLMKQFIHALSTSLMYIWLKKLCLKIHLFIFNLQFCPITINHNLLEWLFNRLFSESRPKSWRIQLM